MSKPKRGGNCIQNGWYGRQAAGQERRWPCRDNGRTQSEFVFRLSRGARNASNFEYLFSTTQMPFFGHRPTCPYVRRSCSRPTAPKQAALIGRH